MKKIILICFMALFVLSCEDATDIVQDGEINDAATFRTVADARSFLIGDVYRRIDITSEISFTAVFTDEVGIGNNNGGQGKELHRYFLFASDGDASSIWLSKYATINRVNRLIRGAELIVTSTPEEELALKSILAEARAVRAFSYLQLQTFFSTNMADENALGVMLLDFVPEVDVKLPRVANSLIYELMEQDLAFAEENLSALPGVNPFANNYKFITQGFIDAVRARMYLYRKNYTLAAQYAQAAITNSGITLSNALNYNNMWNDVGRGETIFAASRPSAGAWGNIGSIFFFNETSLSGGCFHDMGRNLFNLLDAHPTDVRRINWVDATSTFAPTVQNPTADVIVINKYPGKPNQPLRNDLKIFRISEMNLILAECAVGGTSPNLAAAATLVQAVRSARNTGQTLPVYATAQEAWADILLERRKELCFEGHRYIDLKRLGPVANASIDRNILDDEIVGTPLTLPITDHRFTMPIPQNEVAGNPTIQQNPNY
jgi:starch-binding outer membrane protein, SusD/RagB family